MTRASFRAIARFASAGFASLVVGCGGASSRSPADSPLDEDEPVVLSAGVEVDTRGIDSDALLASSAETAEQEGATALHVIAAGSATEGDRVGGFVRVREDACLVAYARGTPDVEDLDVLAFDDRGTSLTADQSIRPTPAVVLCPPHPDRVYVTARVASGQGLVALGVHAIAPDAAAALAIKLGARMAGDNERLMTQEAWPGLSKRVQQRREDLGGRWMVLRRVSLPVSPRAESYVSAPLPASSCLDVLVMPNEETRGLRVNLADESGRIIARGSDRGRDRVALVCSPVDTTMTVSVRPRRGHGLAAVVLSRSEAGAESELAIRPDARTVAPMQPLDAIRRNVRRQMKAAGHGESSVVGRGQLELGRAVIHRFELHTGCTRFDVLAGEPVTSMRASLWAGDARWATAEGGEQTTLFGCASKPTSVEVEIESQGRAGTHVVEARKEKRPPGALRGHPVAAARLLARANAGGAVVPAASLQQVRLLSVQTDQRANYPVRVSRETCKRVVAALGPGASGVRLQAVRGRKVVAQGHGGTVGSVRVCGTDGPASIQVRILALSGETNALVAVVPE